MGPTWSASRRGQPLPCASHTFLTLPRATIGITTDGTGVGSESWREPQRTLRVPSPPGDAVTERRRSEDLRSAGVVLFWNCLGWRRRTRIWRRALFPRSTVFSGEQKRWVLGTTCISGLGCVCVWGGSCLPHLTTWPSTALCTCMQYPGTTPFLHLAWVTPSSRPSIFTYSVVPVMWGGHPSVHPRTPQDLTLQGLFGEEAVLNHAPSLCPVLPFSHAGLLFFFNHQCYTVITKKAIL